MELFFKVVISIFVLTIIFAFYITRDGKTITPVGEGTITLDSGTYESFPLPDYAAKMVTSEYKSYFIEVEPGLKVHILEVGEGLPVFLMHGNPTSGFLLLVPKSQIKPLNAKVDDAIKTIVSAGIIPLNSREKNN